MGERFGTRRHAVNVHSRYPNAGGQGLFKPYLGVNDFGYALPLSYAPPTFQRESKGATKGKSGNHIVSTATALKPISTTAEMHQQLLMYASDLGVPPEVILAVRSRFWPACDVIAFVQETGLDLGAVLHEIDRLVHYLRDSDA